MGGSKDATVPPTAGVPPILIEALKVGAFSGECFIQFVVVMSPYCHLSILPKSE